VWCDIPGPAGFEHSEILSSTSVDMAVTPHDGYGSSDIASVRRRSLHFHSDASYTRRNSRWEPRHSRNDWRRLGFDSRGLGTVQALDDERTRRISPASAVAMTIWGDLVWGTILLSVAIQIVGIACALTAMAFGALLKKITGRENPITRWMAE